jgi:hypothetical protein
VSEIAAALSSFIFDIDDGSLLINSTGSTPRLGDIAIARLGAFSTTEDHVTRKEKDIPTTILSPSTNHEDMALRKYANHFQ